MQKSQNTQKNTILACLAALSIFVSSTSSAISMEHYSGFPSVTYFDVDKRVARGGSRAPTGITSQPTAASTKQAMAKKVPSGKTIFIIEQKLTDFVKIAATRNNLTADVARGLRGVIRNTEIPVEINDMMDQLSRSFDFDWYQDGDTLHIVRSDRIVSRILSLGSRSYEQLLTTVDEAGLSGSGLEIRHVSASNSVLIKGAASLIAKVELLIESGRADKTSPMLIRHGHVK